MTPLRQWATTHSREELQDAQLVTIVVDGIKQIGVVNNLSAHPVAKFFAVHPSPENTTRLLPKLATDLITDTQIIAGVELTCEDAAMTTVSSSTAIIPATRDGPPALSKAASNLLSWSP